MSETFHFQIRNALTEIPSIHDTIASFCARNSCTDDTCFALTLSLEEALTNVVTHGYEDEGEHSIDVMLTADEHGVGAEIRDDGIPWNPLQAKDPDLDLPIEERPIGGLGVFFVKQLMSHVEYSREDSHNVLRFRKDTAAG